MNAGRTSTTPSEAERVARLAAELAELGRRLAWARHELLSLPVATAARLAPPTAAPPTAAPTTPAPTTPAPTTPAPTTAAPTTTAAPPTAAPPVVAPAGLGGPPPRAGASPSSGPTGSTGPAAAPEPSRPEPARPADRQPAAASVSDGLFSSRVLAWVGGSITLIGVVMFLVLAASRGWFGIPARLIAGAALGVALVAVGRWLHARPGGEVGALALVGTGIAALYLDVGTATAKYHYLPTPVGLVCGLLVVGTGLAIADRWRSAQLSAGVLIGAGFFLPAVTDGSLPLLVGLVLVAQAAAAPVVRRRGWPSTAVIAAVWPLLYGSAAAWETRVPELVGPLDTAGGGVGGTVAVIAVFLVGTAAALVGAPGLSGRVLAWLVVAAPLPALQLAGVHGGWPGALLAGLVGAALLAVGLAPVIPLPRPARVAASAAGAVALFQATVLWFDGAALTSVLLGQALVLTCLAWLLGQHGRLGGPLLGAVGYGLAGLFLAITRDAPLSALTRFPAWPYLNGGAADHPALVTGLAVSALALLVAVGIGLASARVGFVEPWLWIPIGLVALYGAAGIVVTAGLLIAPVPLGFVTAHAVVTVSWTVVALVLLARGLRDGAERAPLRVAGLVLVAAAVAKLLLFDLVALDGLARVAAFVGAGLVLLTAGARYARAVARSRS
jgi:uncharacterized membrane protein